MGCVVEMLCMQSLALSSPWSYSILFLGNEVLPCLNCTNFLSCCAYMVPESDTLGVTNKELMKTELYFCGAVRKGTCCELDRTV